MNCEKITPEKIKEILFDLQSGMTQTKVAEKYQTNQTAISHLKNKYLGDKGMQYACSTYTNKDIIIKLFKEGNSQGKIAKLLNISQPSIHRALKKWGVLKITSTKGWKFKWQVRRLIRRNWSNNRIAGHLNCSWHLIDKMRQAMKKEEK